MVFKVNELRSRPVAAVLLAVVIVAIAAGIAADDHRTSIYWYAFGTLIGVIGLVFAVMARRYVQRTQQAERSLQARLDERTVEIERRHADLDLMSRLAKVGMWTVDLKEMQVFFSREVRRIHEVGDDYVPTFEDAISFYEGTARETFNNGLESCIVSGKPWDAELPFVTAKGNRRFVRTFASAVETNGNVEKLVCVLQDVTDEVVARDDAAGARLRLELATESAQIGLWDWDVEKDRFWSSPNWWHYLGFSEAREAVPDMIADNTIHPDDVGRVHASRDRFFNENLAQLVNEFRHIDADGNWRWILSTGRETARGPDGRITRVSGVYIDIHERKLAAERIAYAAHHDVLTGLANRAKLKRAIADAVSAADKEPFAVLVLDLDRFKAVNDTFGHAAGDALLLAVSSRMRSITKASDIVARMGGDEFAIILGNAENLREVCGTVSARLLEAICSPFEIEGQQINIGVSIGIAVAPEHGEDADGLMRNADAALYKVKANGRNNFRFFDEALAAEAGSRRELEADLRKALARREFELLFQPQVRLATGTVVAAETLIRWNHRRHGAIGASQFIPIAEETGMILRIGTWMIEEACRCAALWPNDVTVAVNLSAAQLGRTNLVEVVTDALTESGLAPSRLELEMTEAVFLRKDDTLLSDLHQLSTMGVRLVLAEFGRADASLGHIRKLPFSKIKIDGSLVANLAMDVQSAAVVCAVTSLARTLDIETTAEGIETGDQATLLAAAGCTLGQGSRFGQPTPARKLFVAERTAGEAFAG